MFGLVGAGIISFDSFSSYHIGARLSFWNKVNNPAFNKDFKQEDTDPIVLASFALSSAIFAPIYGTVLQKIGERPNFIITGSVLALWAHMLLVFIAPATPCILFGMAYAIVVIACISSVIITVSIENLGKGLGLIFMF